MGHRKRDIGLSQRPCHVCGGAGTLRITEIQDTRRWGVVFTVRDREPYRLARCTVCSTTTSVRRTD